MADPLSRHGFRPYPGIDAIQRGETLGRRWQVVGTSGTAIPRVLEYGAAAQYEHAAVLWRLVDPACGWDHDPKSWEDVNDGWRT